MSFFDDFLTETVTDQADRDVLSGMAKKYPGIEKGVQTQKEYKASLGKQRELETLVSKWESWQESSWDAEQKMTKSEVARMQELTQAQQRISELEATQGADMGFDDILKGLKESGYVTGKELEGKYMSSTDARKMMDEGLANQAGAFEYVFKKVTPFVGKFKDEFKEDINMDEFYSFVSSPDNIRDVPAAYEKFVSPRRTTQQLTAAQEELATVRKQTEEARTVALNNAKSPTDTGGAGMGHLQKQQMEKAAGAGAGETGPSLEGATLGKHQLSAMAARAYHESKSAAA